VNLDHVCVNTIRTVAIDAVQQANSGGRWTGIETSTGPLGQGVATSLG